MTRNYYEEKSTTAQGRYDLHTELLSEIRRKMEALLDNAPVVNNYTGEIINWFKANGPYEHALNCSKI